MNPKHLPLLACPKCQEKLDLKISEQENDRVKSGALTCRQSHSFPIVGFIPRFVDFQNYTANFTVQWENWPELLSGYDGYKERFTKETKWSVDLKGLVVLEAGCGAGTFTPFAAATGATVISFDFSNGVEANYARSGHLENVLIVQADIFSIPVPKSSIDRAFCFGVLQHTPDPKKAFRSLCSTLKMGGRVAVDIYTLAPQGHPYEMLLKNKYRMRKLTSGFSKGMILKMVRTYVTLMWPIVSRFANSRNAKLIAFNRYCLFDDYRPRLPGMDPARFKAFAMLDIYDFLGPEYDIPATQIELESWFREEKLAEIEVHPGYNGLEGRGARSAELQ